MAFFDTLTSKSKDVAKKAKDLAEITSLNSQIGSKESEIKNIYREIGKVIYENKAAWKEVDLGEQFAKIENLEEQIAKLKADILVIKGNKVCTQCGAEIASDMKFCPKCGAQAPEDPEEPKEVVVEATEIVEEKAVEEEKISEEKPVDSDQPQ